MDAYFANLYGIVNMKPAAEILGARWAGVADLATSKTRDRILALVRVSAEASGADPRPVVDAARAADPGFQSLNSDAELRVLASAALCEVFKTSSAAADAAALATIALALDGTRGDELSKHVQRAARHYLDDEALHVRAQDSISPEVTSEARASAVQAYQSSTAPLGQNPSAIGQPIAELVTQLTAPYGTALITLQGQLDAVREETNMCWWVLAGYSQHLQQRFADIGVPATCLIAARELAEMTTLLPGPRSATALLDRTLSAAGTTVAALTIPDAVNATPREWREAWLREVSPNTVGNLAPVLLAVQRSLDTESKTDWVSAFAKSTGIQDVALPPPVLSFQAYTESLLVRAVTGLNP